MNPNDFRPGSEIIDAQDKFRDREVGITHPDVPSFIRIRDNGDIEIMSGEGGIIIGKSGQIILIGNSIKMFTKEQGLRWNKKAFNSKATKYNEPTFMVVDDSTSPGLYRDVDYFLDDDMSLFSGTTLPESLLSIVEEDKQEETEEDATEFVADF